MMPYDIILNEIITSSYPSTPKGIGIDQLHHQFFYKQVNTFVPNMNIAKLHHFTIPNLQLQN
jgi:hypothetical protein